MNKCSAVALEIHLERSGVGENNSSTMYHVDLSTWDTWECQSLNRQQNFWSGGEEVAIWPMTSPGGID